MTEPKRKKSLSDTIDLTKLSTKPANDLWEDLNQQIEKGKIIPIIGNSVRNERIFDINDDYVLGVVQKDTTDPLVPKTVDEELSILWARILEYPFLDKNRLARVAVYNLIKNDGHKEKAKIQHLDFLKKCLLQLTEDDEDVSADLIEELRSRLPKASFAEIACELGYPKFKVGQTDPLRLLAKLPLPIYVTTSYYNFMERALEGENKSPRTEICCWFDLIKPILSELPQNLGFTPTPREPLVYHLHGLEEQPATLVLSEDDYMNFLVNLAKDPDLIPYSLRQALTQSSLLLLGYRLQDWDLRVLFGSVIKPSSLRPINVAIQLDPAEQGGITDREKAQAYLQQYFEKKEGSFKVEWGSTDTFINVLWQKWNEWSRTA